MSKSVLVIAAHPDDEVIGCGGTIARHADEGDRVNVLIIAEGATSRDKVRNREECRGKLEILASASQVAGKILGAISVETLDYPDNRLDSVDRLELIKEVERAIQRADPEIVYFHHSGDLNVDHRRVHEAVVTACRPQPGLRIKTLLSFEVASSTEWQAPGTGELFQPNWFTDISSQLERKRLALEAYACEMRSWPHARSIKAIEHLAHWRGAQVGVEAAEAFYLVRQIRKCM